MRALIVKNISTPQPWATKMLEDIECHIRRSNPDAQVEVCAAADGQLVPDLTQFQLVVLTGGMLDLMTSLHESWVQHVLSRIRDVVVRDTQTKLVGMCWGHQVVHLAMGGAVGEVTTGPRVSHLPSLNSCLLTSRSVSKM